MPRVQLPLGFSYYQSETLLFSHQRCINWIPTVAESSALNTRMLAQPMGLKQVVDTGLGACRGGWQMDGVPYFVCGNSLVSIDNAGTITNHGTITGSGRVSIATNGRYLVVLVPNGVCHVYDKGTTTLSEVTDADFRLSDTVVFKDGYFVFSASDGSVFFNSALNDPFTYSGLDFGTAEISPDRITALHVNHNELFVCGSETIELHQNVGGADFPFQRIQGANIQKGVYAKFSLVEFDNTFCFIGGGLNEKAAIWKVTGSSSAQKISTDAIDKEIQSLNQEAIENAFSYTFSARGQFFAAFTLQDASKSRTFVYNATASALLNQHIWFELQDGVTDSRFRVQCVVQAYGRLYVGDSQGGIIGELDQDTLTYYGDEIFRQSTSQPFNQDGQPVFAGEFEATIEAGVTPLGADEAVIRMDYSDNGRTFSNETQRGLGDVGEYGRRAVWRRQGRFPVSRTVRLTMTDPVKGNLIGLAATPEAGY